MSEEINEEENKEENEEVSNYGGNDCFIGRLYESKSDSKPIDIRYTDHNGN